MKVRAGRILFSVSLLFLAITVFFWFRGLSVQDKLQLNLAGRTLIVGSFPEHLGLTLSPPNYSDGWSITWQTDVAIQSHPAYRIFRARADNQETSIWLPHWLIALIVSVPALHSLLTRLSLKRFPAGMCRNCGYDLRATPDRCPECGAMANGPLNQSHMVRNALLRGDGTK